MQSVTRSQVQELVGRLPAGKLPLVYDLLLELVEGEAETPSLQRRFLRLPLNERRRIMAEQAQQMVDHYEETSAERQGWQAGEFSDEY